MFEAVFGTVLSGLALAFPAAALFAFVHDTQTRLVAQFPPIPGASPPVSIVWPFLIAGLVGLIYGMQWPHDVVLAVGGALFFSGWVTKQRFVRWLFTVVFFGSISFSTSSLEAVTAARFSVATLPDPLFLLLTIAVVAGAALLFRYRPRHAPRVIGAATRDASQPARQDAGFDTLAFSLLLLVASLLATSWSPPSPTDAALLGAAPRGVGFGIGLALTLQGVASLERQYRGIEPRSRSNLLPLMVAIIGIAVLGLMGVELRLLGMTLFIGYLAAACTLIAIPTVNLIPPALASPRGSAPEPSSARKAGGRHSAAPPPRRSSRRRSPTAQSQSAGPK